MTYANDTHATFARILQNLGAHFSEQNERFDAQHFSEQDGLNSDFCELLKAIFGINASKANADDLREIGENPAEFFAQSALFSATHFDFENALLYYTNTDLSDIAPASTGHKNIGFTLMPCASHKRADLANATRAINKAIANYNIIFFVGEDSSLRGGKAIHAKNSVNLNQNPQNSLNFHANSAKNPQIQSENSRPHLSIAFATRRFSRQTTLKKDIVEKIIIIKDINLRAPSLAQLLNLEKLHREFASTLAHAKAQPIALDEFYARVIEIFSISALNSEFYTEIVRIFNALWHECKFPQNTSESDKRAFCLRLICRLLFCKFLEKKGLIDERLWDTNLAQDYYHELLEPLFFATLNTPQNERDYLSYGILDENSAPTCHSEPAKAGEESTPYKESVNLKMDSSHSANAQNDETNANSAQNLPNLQALLNAIPYLNGGLFAAQKNDFFSPQNPVQNRGILAVPNALIEAFFTLLNRYHFSIDEGSVNVQIVGLNPELLGLVFENLLAKLSSEQDEAALAKSLRSDIEDFEKSQKSEKNPKNSQRKATGSYYTPREIVSFMVRESLFAYLHRATKIHAEKLREFIFSDEAAHFENAKTSAILSALKSLKILDPACGSGAFPMGILNEILALQERLGDTRTPHARKLEALQSCIYGIDIQPMATEIARLRCFLSLIIDENPHDIKPLPNLEFKFICANSLLPLPVSASLHYDGYEKDIKRLNELRNEYFSTQDKSDIQKQYLHLRADITRKDLQVNMSDESLKNPLLAYDPFDSQSVAGFFDSEFMFGVSGFDIVIGNPPYGAKITPFDKAAYKAHYKHANVGSIDTYKLFIEKGFDLLKKNGFLNFIVPMSITSSASNTNLHKFLLANCEQIAVSSYGERPAKIFQNAEQKVSIIGFVKTLTPCQSLLTTGVNKRYSTQSVASVIEKMSFVNSLEFVRDGAFCKISLPIERTIMQKLYAQKFTLKDFMQGAERVYYRFAGGRYYKIYTSYSTNSSAEKNFAATNAKAFVALLSSTLFWWFRNSYSDDYNVYLWQFEQFPIPKFSDETLSKLRELGELYENDIEKNTDFSNGVKTYKIRKSKHIIDQIDRLICPLYALTPDETEFIINYELEFRTDNKGE